MSYQCRNQSQVQFIPASDAKHAAEMIPGAIASIPSAISTGASYALAAPFAVSSTISYLWPWRSSSATDEPSLLIPQPDTFTTTEIEKTVSEVTLNESLQTVDPKKYTDSSIESNLDQALKDEKGPELLPIPQDSEWSPWISLGITTAAVAFSGSLLAISTMTVVRRVALAYAVSHAEEARQRLQFLYPIWGESSKDSESRLLLLKEMNQKDSFIFKSYYVEVLMF